MRSWQRLRARLKRTSRERRPSFQSRRQFHRLVKLGSGVKSLAHRRVPNSTPRAPTGFGPLRIRDVYDRIRFVYTPYGPPQIPGHGRRTLRVLHATGMIQSIRLPSSHTRYAATRIRCHVTPQRNAKRFSQATGISQSIRLPSSITGSISWSRMNRVSLGDMYPSRIDQGYVSPEPGRLNLA